MTEFNILTIFPEIFNSYFNESILQRAQKNKLIQIKIYNLRDYTQGKHKQVDDRPYGGGPGMILMVEPIAKALNKVNRKQKTENRNPASANLPTGKAGASAGRQKTRIIMLTPAGKKFNQREAERLAKYQQIVLLCGRYEGFDARVDKLVDEKISIGDYVLAGGELPAMVLVEAISRQIPGVVGHQHALDEETFSKSLDYIEYPQYTRPEVFKRQVLKVPKVLLSGNHIEIKKWREGQVKTRKEIRDQK